MSPYEVELLLAIYVSPNMLGIPKTQLKIGTIEDFARRGLIEAFSDATYDSGWQTTKLGQVVCNKICSIDESDIKLCGECGQVIPDENARS